MNMQQLAEYVNLEVDDFFPVDEIARWFNKGIADYNLIPPITDYPYIDIESDEDYEALSKTFMLGIMVPFIASSVRAQEAAIDEQQTYYARFLENARQYKSASNISDEYLLNKRTENLSDYQIGENVYVDDMNVSPMKSNWGHNTIFPKKHSDDD